MGVYNMDYLGRVGETRYCELSREDYEYLVKCPDRGESLVYKFYLDYEPESGEYAEDYDIYYNEVAEVYEACATVYYFENPSYEPYDEPRHANGAWY